MIHDEIEGFKRRQVETKACVESLIKDANTYYHRAENESDMYLSISSKQELIKNLDLAIKKLEEETKTLK